MDDSETMAGLNGFLDALAARNATPGGGAVAAAGGALACALARMVAAYSKSNKADPHAQRIVVESAEQLERADALLRGLLLEDMRAYDALTEATRRARDDASAKPDHQAALMVAAMVPMEVAATACESLAIVERLQPAASRHLVSDLGVASVLAEATVRAASYMVYVNAYALDDPEIRQKVNHEIDQLLVRARDSLTRIEFRLRDRF